MTFNVGNAAPGFAPQPQMEQERRLLLTNTAKTESVLLTPSSFICETTAYREFDDFRANVAAVCDALIGANVRSALVRVGIRYIDEVRPPERITDARGWGKWIDSRVLGPLTVGPGDIAVTNAQGLVTFDLGDGNGLNFQYAALNQHPVVQPQFLTRQQFGPEPFFVLDIDGYRDFAGQQDTVPARRGSKSPTSSPPFMIRRAQHSKVQSLTTLETYFEEGPHDDSDKTNGPELAQERVKSQTTQLFRKEPTGALSLEADYLRTKSDLISIEVEDVHERAREMDLADRTLAKSRHAVPGLLEELAYQRGMAWSHIAEIADVSVSAVRKWRKGNDASPESRSRLARFAALLDMLEQKGRIQDPANWMEMDLPLGAGYHIRPLDLYLKGHDVSLLDIAEHRKTVEHTLDDIQSRWRETRSKFEVFEDTDGLRSIRMRRE